MKSVTSRAAWICSGAVLFMASIAYGADWPQWRGPQRDGTSTETGLLKEWKDGGPALLWHAKDIGGGYSTPAVVGKRLYLLSDRGNADEFVLARDATTGNEVWSTRIGKVGNPDQRPSYPGARSTPTVDGDVLYALGSDGDLACLDAATGNPRWQKNLRSEFDGRPGEWAYAESPLIDGDVLVCTPGGGGATMVALNKTNGDVIWKCAVPGGDDAAYSSAIVIDSNGVRQYVQFLGKGLVGVDAKTGAFLWRYDRTAKGSPANMATPVARDGHVYSAAPRTGGALVRLTREQGKFDAEEVYFNNKLPTAIGGAVLVGEQLYGTTGQVLVCADFKTGKVNWTDRSVGTGSVCYAEGRLYLHGENGDVALVEATPDGYREKGRFTPPDQPDRGRSKAWAYPVVADGKLYIRDMGSVWCYDVTDPAAKRAAAATNAGVVDRAALEREFEQTLTNSVLIGRFTTEGSNDPPKEDRYHIAKITKQDGDNWLFQTRLRYAGADLVVPLVIPVRWAGDTPMIQVSDMALAPAGRAYSARVMIFRDQYAGTWSSPTRSGYLFGRIEREPKAKVP